jgi:hypothetical protein
VPHVEFDATIDELTDVHLRLSHRATAYRRGRARNRWVVGGSCALAIAGGAFGRMARPVPLSILLVITIAAVAGGVIIGFLYGRFEAAYVRRHARRSLVELHGGTEPFRCEFEIRRDGLWARSKDVETTFAWPKLVRVAETDGDVEFTFDPGLVVIRARAFPTPADRAAFLNDVRLVAPTAVFERSA